MISCSAPTSFASASSDDRRTVVEAAELSRHPGNLTVGVAAGEPGCPEGLPQGGELQPEVPSDAETRGHAIEENGSFRVLALQLLERGTGGLRCGLCRRRGGAAHDGDRAALRDIGRAGDGAVLADTQRYPQLIAVFARDPENVV